MAAKVTNMLVGATDRAKFAAVQGSAWSNNIYYSRNGKNEYMESVPGLKKFAMTSTSAVCRGSYVSTIGLRSESSPEDMFAVFGTTFYRVTPAGTLQALGTVAPSGRISFAETGGPRALLLIADGVNLQAYDLLEGGALKNVQLPERITESGVTIRPTHVAVVGGSIVVNDAGSGYCYYSKAYPLASDTRTMFKMQDGKPVYALDGVTVLTEDLDAFAHVFEDDYHVQQYFNTESSSDNINGIYAVGPTLYVFGPKTVEIWQRGTGEYEDWVRTSYTAQNSFGLEAPFSVASSGSVVYFVASGAQYGKCVMMATGTQFKKVSETFLDDKLMKNPEGQAYGFCYSEGEHNFFVMQLPGCNETWVYDALDGGWHQRSTVGDLGRDVRWRAESVAYWREKFYAFTRDGLVCTLMRDYFVEDFRTGETRPVIRRRQTGVVVDNFRPFTIEELAVECNVGMFEDYDTEPQMMLEVSKDGGHTFGTAKAAGLGHTGQYSHRVRWRNLGYNRKCVVRVSFSAPVDLVISSCEIRATATEAMI